LVDFINGKQAVALRANVTQLQENVARQLPLDREIVLIRILRPHVWLEISKIRSAEKPGPIQRLAARRIQDTGERIRMDTARLIHKGRLQERAGNGFTAPEWRLGAELLQYELLDRIVKNSVPHADAGLARPTGQLGQPAIARSRA